MYTKKADIFVMKIRIENDIHILKEITQELIDALKEIFGTYREDSVF